MQAGGSLSVKGGSLCDNGIIAVTDSVVDVSSLIRGGQMVPATSTGRVLSQCYRPYTTLTDTWRATSTGYDGHPSHSGSYLAPGHCDQRSGDTGLETGVGGGRWYRFAGAGGDALPLSSAGRDHCGTTTSGWLSGWSNAGDPPNMYSGAGRYPAVAEGVAEMTACFADSPTNTCNNHVAVGWCAVGDSCCGGCRTRRAAPSPTARRQADCEAERATLALSYVMLTARSPSPAPAARSAWTRWCWRTTTRWHFSAQYDHVQEQQ